MKFLCVPCDEQMEFEERSIPGDGTLAAAFRCPACDHVTAMLTNPMETRLVSSLGVSIGGRQVPEQPLEGIRTGLAEGTSDGLGDPLPAEPGSSVRWSVDAVERLAGVPRFVRGMVKKIYTEYAKENGIEEITPAVMDRARSDLGLEGMQVKGEDDRRVGTLRVRIDRLLCVGFGDCVDAAPEAFVLDDESIAVFARPEEVASGRLLEACAACPVDALTVWDFDGKQLVP